MGGEFIGGFDDIDALHKSNQLSELLKKHEIEHDDHGIKIVGKEGASKKFEMPKNIPRAMFLGAMNFKWTILRRTFLCGGAGGLGFYFLGPWGLLCAVPVFIIDKIVSKNVEFGSLRPGMKAIDGNV